MPDNQLDILIKFGLSKEKATEAVAEIKKIETAAKEGGKTAVKADDEAGKAKDKLNIKTSESRKLVEKLTREFPLLGSAVKTVMNPVGTIIGGIIAAIAIFRSEIIKTSEAIIGFDGQSRGKDQIAEIAQVFADATKKAEEFRLELESARRGDTEANRILKERAAEMKAADEAEDKALKDRKATESELEGVQNRRKVRDAQFKIESARLLKAESDEMERSAVEAEANVATVAASIVRLRQQVKMDSAEKANLDAFIDTAEKNGNFIGPMGAVIGTDSEYFQGLKRRQSGIGKSLMTDQASLYQLENFGMPRAVSSANAARAGAISAGRSATEMGFQGQLDMRFAPGATERGIVADAAAGADAISAGGKATAAQSSAMMQIVRAFNLQQATSEQLIRMMARMNDSAQNTNTAVRQLSSRLTMIEHR